MNQTNQCRRFAGVLTALLLSQICLVGGLSCKRAGEAPPPLALEQIPAELEKVFLNGTAEAKGLVTEITSNLQSKDYSAAFRTLQSLSGNQGLNKDQRSILARCMLTVTSLLQAADAQGDQKAAATLKEYYMNK
jgi:hypothetical protein